MIGSNSAWIARNEPIAIPSGTADRGRGQEADEDPVGARPHVGGEVLVHEHVVQRLRDLARLGQEQRLHHPAVGEDRPEGEHDGEAADAEPDGEPARDRLLRRQQRSGHAQPAACWTNDGSIAVLASGIESISPMSFQNDADSSKMS